MDTSDYSKAQGHWILARMGKRVLRPGGKELTLKLINMLRVTNIDDIVEFAPGIGYTAGLSIAKQPNSYIGIDADKDVVRLLQNKFKGYGKRVSFIHSNAADTPIESNSKDKVYGEAMLTMHADHRKLEIIREAYRMLKPGGVYAIHELGLCPDSIDEATKATIQRDLALSIKVNARPLTVDEWKQLLEKEHFVVRQVETNAMSLLETGRLIDDEGFFRFLKISFNILTHPKAKQRILQMRSVFKKYKKNINAVAIIAEKV